MRRIVTSVTHATAALLLVFAFVNPGSSSALTNAVFPLSSGSQAGIVGSDFALTQSGRYMVFGSNKTDVVSGDTNGKADIFVRDTVANTTTRVSVSSSGAEANDNSMGARITNNGRYVLFDSYATNLADVSGVPGYTRGTYLRDIKTGQTTLITAGYYQFVGNVTKNTFANDLSEDGRFIYYDVYLSSGFWQAYVKDRNTNTETKISTNNSGTEGNQTSQYTSASCDGRFAVFQSAASNLVSGDTNNDYDIYLVDMAGTRTIRSLTLGGNGMSVSPQISCDGNYVTYYSMANNIVSTTANTAVYVYDVANDTTEIISKDTSGNDLNDIGMALNTLSLDGRYAAFSASVSNGVTSTSKSYQLFVRDRHSNTTTTISQNSSSQLGNGDNSGAIMSYDGKSIIYMSTSDNLGFSNPGNYGLIVKASDF